MIMMVMIMIMLLTFILVVAIRITVYVSYIFDESPLQQLWSLCCVPNFNGVKAGLAIS